MITQQQKHLAEWDFENKKRKSEAARSRNRSSRLSPSRSLRVKLILLVIFFLCMWSLADVGKKKRLANIEKQKHIEVIKKDSSHGSIKSLQKIADDKIKKEIK